MQPLTRSEAMTVTIACISALAWVAILLILLFAYRVI